MTDEHTAVLDDDLAPVAPGEVGRLARSGWIPLGYHGDEARSAATFPVVDGVRWSVPGDLARLEEDGTITVLGRGSTSINTGGEKVFPEEVENVLKGHPAVFDALVVGVPDDRYGERVTAVIALRPGTGRDDRRPDDDELDRARPGPPRRLQGAAALDPGRALRTPAHRQARLPLGEGGRQVELTPAGSSVADHASGGPRVLRRTRRADPAGRARSRSRAPRRCWSRWWPPRSTGPTCCNAAASTPARRWTTRSRAWS